MIIRKVPKNIDEYVKVNTKTTLVLHHNGFIPKYMDEKGEYYFYEKSDDILIFMKNNNLVALN